MSSNAPHATDWSGLRIGTPTSAYRRRAIPWLGLAVPVASAAHLLQLAAGRGQCTAQPATGTVTSGDKTTPGSSLPVFLPITGYDPTTGAPQQAQCFDLLQSSILAAMTTQELEFLDGLKC